MAQDGQIEAAQMLLDLYNVYGVGSKDFGTDYEQSFGQEQSAMVYDWGHFYGYLSTNYPNVNYGTFEIPADDENPFAYDRYNGESTPGINANASDAQKEVAQDFIRFYLANDDAQKELCMYYSLFPAKDCLREDADIMANPAVSAVAEHIDNYIWPGAMPSTVENNMSIACEDMLYNGVAPEKALQDAEDIVKVDLSNQEFESAESLYYRYDER